MWATKQQVSMLKREESEKTLDYKGVKAISDKGACIIAPVF